MCFHNIIIGAGDSGCCCIPIPNPCACCFKCCAQLCLRLLCCVLIFAIIIAVLFLLAEAIFDPDEATNEDNGKKIGPGNRSENKSEEITNYLKRGQTKDDVRISNIKNRRGNDYAGETSM
ncbi:uncharacterized protein LOC131846865 [Achroia grisella]|uniref:uncharacterized protein LOC131846865 n=1 Tax=Achroia grisella TaxID=688607 RepID=UPI0027D2265E|nr:uncharacterized protein LOC131846865 [Achroia grisella]